MASVVSGEPETPGFPSDKCHNYSWLEKVGGFEENLILLKLETQKPKYLGF